MIGHNFFLHINSTNLAGYFSCACLKPAKYFKNRLDDTQNKCDAVLLLSTKRYSTEADCSLEVVLTKEEKESLKPINSREDIYFLNNAIPISRVLKIYFNSDETKDKIISLINLSSGFVPESLAAVITDNDFADYSQIEIPKDDTFQDLTEKIKKYDSLLGGFALMRLAGEEYMNYSDNYFSTLSYFNSVIESELINANRKINDIFWDAFSGFNSFKHLFQFINKELTSQDVELIAKQENQKVQKNSLSGIIDINSLERGTYLIAVIYSYGMSEEGRKNKIDGLILNNFKKDIRSDKSEVIALCYGLNRGYSCFSNKYKSASSEKVVKFELNSQVDYYTIEALYQHAFNGINRSSEFPYIDPWCAKSPKPKKILKKSEYIILDKIVKGRVIRPGDAAWWADLTRSFFSKNGEEYFKPFLNKIFEKFKTDFESDYQELILDKDETISNLNKEISKFKNDLLSEKSNHQFQIENLKNEISHLKSKSVTIEEANPEYLSALKIDKQENFQQSTVINLQNLVKEIKKQSNVQHVKKLIKKFEESGKSENTINFPEK
jgi:hypothetical protein